MRIVLAFVTALSVTAVVPSVVAPSMADLGTALSARHQSVLAEASLPSPGGRDTALADSESSGPTRFGRDTAQTAEAESSGPTRFGRDTAQTAEASLPSPGGRDTAV